MRSLFKRIHEVLYEIEATKTKEIENLLQIMFGQRIRVDDVQGMQQIAEQHLETVTKLFN